MTLMAVMTFNLTSLPGRCHVSLTICQNDMTQYSRELLIIYSIYIKYIEVMV